MIDGFTPNGVEDEAEIGWSKDLLRKIGYKLDAVGDYPTGRSSVHPAWRLLERPDTATSGRSVANRVCKPARIICSQTTTLRLQLAIWHCRTAKLRGSSLHACVLQLLLGSSEPPDRVFPEMAIDVARQ